MDRLVRVPPLVAFNAAETFRHSGWASMRTKVWSALWSTHQRQSRRQAFAECGRCSYVLQSDTTPPEYRLAGSACHDRFCTPCANARSRRLASNCVARLAGQRARFLTLTLDDRIKGLRDKIAALYKSFHTLKRLAFWRSRVTGGVAFLELKWNEVPGRWHPHLHVLLQGTYLPHDLIKQAWQRITGGSFVVDIRNAGGSETVTRYVTKYACKPLNTTYMHDHELLCEAVKALRNRRMAIAFGDWKGVLLVDDVDETG